MDMFVCCCSLLPELTVWRKLFSVELMSFVSKLQRFSTQIACYLWLKKEVVFIVSFEEQYFVVGNLQPVHHDLYWLLVVLNDPFYKVKEPW